MLPPLKLSTELLAPMLSEPKFIVTTVAPAAALRVPFSSVATLIAPAAST